MGGDVHDDEPTDLAAAIVSDTSGWEAIDAALRDVHGDQEPVHVATAIKYAAGGKDPLDGISAYRSDHGRPHWHIVSYGLSELYEKTSQDPSTSGWGFELSFRLTRGPGEDRPPAWTLSMLQNLARYVFESGKVLEPSHHLNANGPLAHGTGTALRGLLFVCDPELPAIETSNGRLEFVQAVGVTLDELVAIEAWDGERFAELLAARDPLHITDLARASVLADPTTAATVAAGTERDGSSMGALTTDHLLAAGNGHQLELSISPNVAGYVARLMRGRLLHDRELTVRARTFEVLFEPAPIAEWKRDGEALVVDTPPALAHEIADTLQPRTGIYAFRALPGFTIRVL